jgi:DNA-binding response OmpR family regulator
MQRETIVVIADGDAAARSEMRRGLETAGFLVVEAANGDVALHALRSREVRVLVTDLYLRTDTEPCLLRSLRREAALRRVKVLVVTAHQGTRDREWALREGADAFLARPAELGRVLHVAGRLARSRGPARRASRA